MTDWFGHQIMRTTGVLTSCWPPQEPCRATGNGYRPQVGGLPSPCRPARPRSYDPKYGTLNLDTRTGEFAARRTCELAPHSAGVLGPSQHACPTGAGGAGSSAAHARRVGLHGPSYLLTPRSDPRRRISTSKVSLHDSSDFGIRHDSALYRWGNRVANDPRMICLSTT